MAETKLLSVNASGLTFELVRLQKWKSGETVGDIHLQGETNFVWGKRTFVFDTAGKITHLTHNVFCKLDNGTVVPIRS